MWIEDCGKRHFSCLHHVRGASDYIWQNLLSKVQLVQTPTLKPVEVGRRHNLIFEIPTYIWQPQFPMHSVHHGLTASEEAISLTTLWPRAWTALEEFLNILGNQHVQFLITKLKIEFKNEKSTKNLKFEIPKAYWVTEYVHTNTPLEYLFSNINMANKLSQVLHQHLAMTL